MSFMKLEQITFYIFEIRRFKATFSDINNFLNLSFTILTLFFSNLNFIILRLEFNLSIRKNP